MGTTANGIKHIRFDEANTVEKNADIFLNKCSRNKATVISYALKEFIEKYQLSELGAAEIREFMKTYISHVEGKYESMQISKLQKSLSLIENTQHYLKSFENMDSFPPVQHADENETKRNMDTQSVETLPAQATSLVDADSRTKMNRALSKFQTQ